MLESYASLASFDDDSSLDLSF